MANALPALQDLLATLPFVQRRKAVQSLSLQLRSAVIRQLEAK